MSWEFVPVAGPFEFTEGPVWDPDKHVVYFSDIPNHRIMRYDPETDQCTEYITGTNRGNGLALGHDGRLYCCQMGGHRVSCYDSEGDETVIADEYEGDRLNSPNDLLFDEVGRLWFTDPIYDDQKNPPLGHKSIYRLEHRGNDEWEIMRVTYDTTNPNGLGLSPEETTLYVAQSEYGEGNPRELRAYPIQSDGTVGEYEVLHNFYPGRGIDGMCLDEDGNIVATAGWDDNPPGSMIYVFAPNGRVLETHPYPTNKPTNCAFGGPDLTTLYTTGDDGMLYAVETDRVGYPVPR